MSRSINRLTTRGVAALSEPGLHADGGGLYLRIDEADQRRWAFIYHFGGKRREMGLGNAVAVSLKDARDLADKHRSSVARGVDPLEEKRRAKIAGKTFEAVLDELLVDLEAEWTSDKHKAQWRRSLEIHAAKLLPKPAAAVETQDVLEALRPIWSSSAPMARKVRGRIERVLDAAKVSGVRTGDNPARWRGHLALLLPSITSDNHYDALHYDDLPGFMLKLRGRTGVAAKALEFTILTAARTNETLGAVAAEFDFDALVWTVPAERMKAGKEHRVPLSTAAAAIAQEMLELGGEYVFPGRPTKGKRATLSNMTMAMLLDRMGFKDATVHGFRSTFSDWVGDLTSFPEELAEQALAHAVGNAVKRAYRRRDALERRRQLMDAWADYCCQDPAAKVVQLFGA